MKNVFLALLAAVALALAPTLAEAGGGTKANASITVVNNSGSRLVVFLDQSQANQTTILTLAPGTTVDANVQGQFNTFGGRTVDAGASTQFTGLQAGNHTVTAEFVTDTTTGGVTTTTSGTAGNTTVHLNKGQHRTVTFTGGAGAAPSATVTP